GRLPSCVQATSMFFDSSLPDIHSLSLHDALPICAIRTAEELRRAREEQERQAKEEAERIATQLVGTRVVIAAQAGDEGKLYGSVDRKSTRLNSSHVKISYAVFCLKKKIKRDKTPF